MRSEVVSLVATVTLHVSMFVVAAPVWAQVEQGPEVDVRVDPRVELLSVVFRLAGSPEYSRGRVERYAEAVDAHFGPFRRHSVIAHAKRLRALAGVSFDAVASFSVHLDDAMPPGEGMEFEPLPSRLDQRWGCSARVG